MLNISKVQIKEYSKLKQKKFRKETNLFLAEGIKTCDELVKSDYQIDKLIIEKNNYELLNKFQNYLSENSILLASNDEISRISDTGTPQDVLAIAEMKENTIDYSKNFIYLDDIQDPGNLGTIIRTALWFGVENIFLSENSADYYNPKVIRSTMGALFHSNIIRLDNDFNFKKNFPGFKLIGTDLKTEKKINEITNENNYGLFFGNESKGLRQEILNILDESFLIPGSGQIESLNLSIAVGISLFHFFENK